MYKMYLIIYQHLGDNEIIAAKISLKLIKTLLLSQPNKIFPCKPFTLHVSAPPLTVCRFIQMKTRNLYVTKATPAWMRIFPSFKCSFGGFACDHTFWQTIRNKGFFPQTFSNTYQIKLIIHLIGTLKNYFWHYFKLLLF